LLLETVEASHGGRHGLAGHASFQAEAILFFLKRLPVTGRRTRDITVAGIRTNTFITALRGSGSETAEAPLLAVRTGRHFDPFAGYTVSKQFAFFDFGMFGGRHGRNMACPTNMGDPPRLSRLAVP